MEAIACFQLGVRIDEDSCDIGISISFLGNRYGPVLPYNQLGPVPYISSIGTCYLAVLDQDAALAVVPQAYL